MFRVTTKGGTPNTVLTTHCAPSQILPKTNMEITVVNSFKLTKQGLIPVGNPTFDEWVNVGKFLKDINQSIHWIIGDWLNYGEAHWGEMYTQAIEDTGFDYKTLSNDKYTASRIDLSRRRENVPHSTHHAVASLNTDKQDEILDKAESEKLTRREVRELIAPKIEESNHLTVLFKLLKSDIQNPEILAFIEKNDLSDDEFHILRIEPNKATIDGIEIALAILNKVV